MSTNFPTTLDTSTTLPAESASTPLSTNHVTAHQNIQDALEAVEAKIGVDSSAVTTSHDYKLGEVTSTDKAVGKTATQTLTNKTLTAPVITSPTINLTSDAEGDTYYRNSSGAFVRLARGTDNYIYKMNGNVPNWEAETVTNNASTTVAGISEIATAAQITAGTGTGETGAVIVMSPDNFASSAPAFDGTNMTKIRPISAIDAPTRSLATNYQNTSGKNMFVMATMKVTRGSSANSGNFGRATAYMDTTTTPTTVVGWVESIQPTTGTNNEDYTAQTMMLTFVVPNNSYYRIDSTATGSGAGASIEEWTEQTL